jgi:hypothetical protein
MEAQETRIKKKHRRFLPKEEHKKRLALERAKLYTKDNAVYNFSHHTLTLAQFSLLCLGLSFCPTPKYVDTTEVFSDCLVLFRKLKLMMYFKDRGITNTPSHLPACITMGTGWTPPIRNNLLDSFTAQFLDKALRENKKKHKDNLTRDQRTALQELRELDNVIIKPADKGGAVVLWDRELYIAEVYRQLNDTKTYTVLKKDPTSRYAKEIETFLRRIQSHLPDKVFEMIRPKNCKPGIFYLLPKIHKLKNITACTLHTRDTSADLTLLSIPGRPICSQISTVTEKLSAYVDRYLQPLAQGVNSYVRDSSHLLDIVNALPPLKQGTLLVTIDVSALYTAIPHREGISACRNALISAGNQDCHNWIILRLIHFILNMNHFEFLGKHYVQIHGTAMGTRIGPNYAVIFMSVLEEQFIASRTHKPQLWKRYIDDIICIWCHGRELLMDFLEDLNSFHNTIKFTWSISETSVDFLDMTLFIKENGRLGYKLFTKATDAHLYLHYRSAHPKHVLNNIPKNQYDRLLRINQAEHDQKLALNKLKLNLSKREYPDSLLKQRNRSASPQEKEDTNKIIFITSFSPKKPNFKKIWDMHLPLLQHHPDTRSISESRLIIAYKRCTSLRDVLTSSTLHNGIRLRGSRPCGNCYLCPYINTTNTANSTQNDFIIKINGDLHCRTPNMIYLITCTQCNKQYVGETGNDTRTRFRGHFQDIRENTGPKPVGMHFNLHDVTCLRVTLLRDRHLNNNKRKRTEEALIYQFGSFTPDGMNIKEH